MNVPRDEAGLVGKMIVVWLLVLARPRRRGDRCRLDRVHDLQALGRRHRGGDARARRLTRRTATSVRPVSGSRGVVAAQEPTAKVAHGGCSIERPTGLVTVKVGSSRTRVMAQRDPVDGEVRHRGRDGDRRAALAVAFETVDASETDELLVRRFQDGSAEAFEILVQRHGTRVYNLCLRILGDAEEAADASQDTFLAALRKLSTFRGDSAFTTWLHRVAVNACYDSLRRKRRRPLLQIVRDEGDERPEPSLPAPDHADRVVLSVDVATGADGGPGGVPRGPRAGRRAGSAVRRDRTRPGDPGRDGEIEGLPRAGGARAGPRHGERGTLTGRHGRQRKRHESSLRAARRTAGRHPGRGRPRRGAGASGCLCQLLPGRPTLTRQPGREAARSLPRGRRPAELHRTRRRGRRPRPGTPDLVPVGGGGRGRRGGGRDRDRSSERRGAAGDSALRRTPRHAAARSYRGRRSQPAMSSSVEDDELRRDGARAARRLRSAEQLHASQAPNAAGARTQAIRPPPSDASPGRSRSNRPAG